MSIILINRHNEVELAMAHEQLMSNIFGYAADVQTYVDQLVVMFNGSESAPAPLVGLASNMAMLMSNIEDMSAVLKAGSELGMGVNVAEDEAPVEEPALTDPYLLDDQPQLAAEAEVEELEETQPIDSDPQAELAEDES